MEKKKKEQDDKEMKVIDMTFVDHLDLMFAVTGASKVRFVIERHDEEYFIREHYPIDEKENKVIPPKEGMAYVG